MATTLRAPFPYFGHKGSVAPVVWERLGNPGNYVEPFAGSLAVLLQRPQPGKREVVNDKYGLLCNFWRAVQQAPEQVAKHATWINSESDLHARNAYCREMLPTLTAELEYHPRHYDAELGGWWCYVQCMAIGEAAYADGPWVCDHERKRLINVPQSNGIRRTVPCDGSRGIQRSIPFHGAQGLLARREFVEGWIHKISSRLAGVRILCGDWSRACKPTYTTQHGLTGVFLDPPYVCEHDCYSNSDPLLGDIVTWCRNRGPDPLFRIALCGYEGTLPIDLVAHGWDCYAWTAGGGRVTTGGQSDINRERERIWFSPHCCKPEVEGQLSIFGGEA